MVKLLMPLVALTLIVAMAWVVDRPAPKADFTFVNRGDANTLDLQKISWTQDIRLANAIFEGLVRCDVFSPDQRIIPGVASSWEVSPDGLTYTFHFRPDAEWSTGERVTPADFIYAWRRGLLPEIKCDYVGQLQLIRGALEFTQWREKSLDGFKAAPGAAEALWEETIQRFNDTVGMRAVDDFTLRVELARPAPYFLDLCAFAVFYPVYTPLLKQYDVLDRSTGRIRAEQGWTKPGVIVSNGPFNLATWRFKRDMRLEANPHYWNHAAMKIQSIAIPSIEDGNAAVLAFNGGGVDWLSDVVPEYRADMVADKRRFYNEHRDLVESLRQQGLDQYEIDRRLPPDPRANIHVMPAFGTYWYNFNCLPKLRDGRDNPFRDPRVRRAFTMAIDKQSLTEDVKRCGEAPAVTTIPVNTIAGYASPKGLPFDPVAARELLAHAGYPGGRGLPVIEILFNKDGGHDRVAQAVAKDWERYLGVSVRLDQQETKVFRDELRSQNYMVSRGGWYGDYGDPTTFLDLHRKDDGNNDRLYSSDRFESLMDAASLEADGAKRLALLSEAERIIVEEDLPIAPLYHYVHLFMFDAHRVKGLTPHPRNTQYLHLIEMLDMPALSAEADQGDHHADRARPAPRTPTGSAAWDR